MIRIDDVQVQLRDSARRFLGDAGALPEEPDTAWKAIAELGWLGGIITEEQGGFGGAREAIILAQEIGQALAPLPYLGSGVLPVTFMALSGHSNLGGIDLEDVLAGDRRVSGTFLASTAAGERPRLEPSVGWSLHGTIEHIWQADGADILVVPAVCNNRAEMAIAILDAEAVRAVGTRTATIDGRSVLKVDLSRHSIQPLQVLDSPASIGAWRQAQELTSLAQCAEIVGGLHHMFDLTRDYLTVRSQFGQKLAGFQALRHRFADMFAELDQAEAMLNAGLAALELDDAAARSRVISACRLRIGNAAKFVSAQAIQLHGAIALTEEYALGRYYRRCLVLRKMWGDEESHAAAMTDRAEGRMPTGAAGIVSEVAA